MLSITNGIIEERNILKYELLPELEGLYELKDSLIVGQNAEISKLQELNINSSLQIQSLQQFEEKQRETWEEERKRYRRQKWIIGSSCTGIGLILGLLLGLH